MERTDLQRLSKDELIELVLRLQRPDKTSRTSSKPPSTDKKEKRENSRPGGAKPGHEPVITQAHIDAGFFGFHAKVWRIVWKGFAPLTLAVSIVVRTSASASAAHMARYPLVTFRWITQGRSFRSEPLLVASTSPG
jgi:hypothetical protein